MGIWLVMKTMDGGERPFRVRPAPGSTIIGRETRCDVRIPLPNVSDRHCELRYDGDDLCISDLDSIEGTYHNGERVRQARLSHSDRVTIGSITFEVRIETERVDVRSRVTESKPPQRAVLDDLASQV